MTLQQIGKSLLGFISIATGVFLIALTFMSVNSIDKAVYYANLAILHGDSISSFLRPIAGLLSGGYLKIVDTHYIYLMAISGWILIWLGIQTIIFTKRNISLKYLLGRKYWTVFDWEVIHKRKYRPSDLSWVKNKKKGSVNGHKAKKTLTYKK